MKLRNWVAVATIAGTALAPVHAEAQDQTIKDLLQRIEELDQKVRILERNRELETEAAETKAKTTPTLTVDDKGLTAASADGNFAVRVRGLVQLDSRSYVNDGGINNNDAFVLRRA